MDVDISESAQGPYRVRRVSLPEMGEHVYSVKVSPDGRFIALAFGNGALRTLDAQTLAPLQRAKLGTPYDDLPSTVVRWGAMRRAGDHGHDATGATDAESAEAAAPATVYSLASASAAGAVFTWTWDGSSPGAYIERYHRAAEPKNDTAALDFSPDGLTFATAGSDRSIRIYDFETKSVTATMNRGVDAEGHSRAAHTNRIFSVRHMSPTLLLSAGWECPVQVWDLRTGRSERQISGAQAGADCLEHLPDSTRFVVASNRPSDQLQVFDYITGHELADVSKRLSAPCGRTALSLVRYDPATRSVWVVLTKPHALLNLSFPGGEVLGRVECGQPILSIDISPHHPGKVFASLMNETLLVAERAEAA